MRRFAAVPVAVGAAAGATVRWSLVTAWPPDDGWPWAVLVANVVGCAVLGAAATRLVRAPQRAWRLRDLVGTGFCGGLTTFSTFALELALFVDAGRPGIALAYAVVSVAAGLTAVELGRRLAHRPA